MVHKTWVTIKGERLLTYYCNEGKEFDEYITQQFFNWADSKAPDYFNSSYYVNELFLFYIQPYLVLEYILEFEGLEIYQFNVEEASRRIQCFTIDSCRSKEIRINTSLILFRIISYVKSHLLMLLTFGYLLFGMLKIKKSVHRMEFKELYLARTKASKMKLNNLGVHYLTEDYAAIDATAYAQYGCMLRLGWVFKAWKEGYGELKKIRCLLRSYIGPNTAALASQFYAKRVVHTMLYKKLLINLIGSFQPNNFYTLNNLDRFSVLEEEVCCSRGLKVIGIPHGLEYGFKMPKGFSGDVFYTTSQNAARRLSNLYRDNKFIFDAEFVKSIFKVNGANGNTQEKRVVYFTEPRDKHVNHEIIGTLKFMLEKHNILLSLKLHPKDSKTEYEGYKLEILDSLEESLTSNICIARKSTILLEGIYNGSKSAAVLLNNKDKSIFETFPSLQDDRISIFLNVQDLYLWILKEFKSDQ